jgi:methionyl-tRNA formyltransferase
VNTHVTAQRPKIACSSQCWSESNFDPSISLVEMLETACIPYEISPSMDINSSHVLSAIVQHPESVLIYSGFGGALLKKEILSSGRRFLHIHGGYLPDYKGSTTNYYSLIERDNMGASAIFLTEDIDSGPVLIRREFPSPEAKIDVDHIYDSAARAKVLVEVLRRYEKSQRWDVELENSDDGQTYFVIHPVLKHIAILSKR